MSHCLCGHSEESHPIGGRCRFPGCPCDRFRPVPEVGDGSIKPAWALPGSNGVPSGPAREGTMEDRGPTLLWTAPPRLL
jgi:hypothetical protein